MGNAKFSREVLQYLQTNPLCVCLDEIQQLRKDLGSDAKPEQLKLKQRSSTVILTIFGGEFYYKINARIPEEYPQKCVDLQKQETNLPAVLLRYLNGQSREVRNLLIQIVIL